MRRVAGHVHHWREHISCTDDDMTVTHEMVCLDCGQTAFVRTWDLANAPPTVQTHVIRDSVEAVHSANPQNAEWAWRTLDRVLGLWEHDAEETERLTAKLQATTVLLYMACGFLFLTAILAAFL